MIGREQSVNLHCALCELALFLASLLGGKDKANTAAYHHQVQV